MTLTLSKPETRRSTLDYMVYPGAPTELERLCAELSISPILGQILINRGMRDVESAEAFLLAGHESLLEPELLEGLAEAADILADMVRKGQRILVHGDYDADGVSGTALLVGFLRDVGADVAPYIPHRIDEGYGLSAEGARMASDEGFHCMVSVDCGSSSPQVVELARSLGLKVIVTDHHMVAQAPPADAFVNPRAPGSAYPFPHLSGAGVAYKLIIALSRRLGCGEPEQYLDLAAIGTVGDVVPLVGENRILVREGLAVMERLERPGIAALARVAGIGSASGGEQPPTCARPLTARDIAFEIAPRINACGRLEHAMQAALLLLEQDSERADALAQEIDALNRQRREMEANIRQQAEAQASARGLDGAWAVVEAHTDWHQGIVGITASRLLERYGLPAFVISIGADGNAKGSARAPAHIDLYACLTRCADLFTHFGGHPRAGGFSMPSANVDALRHRLQEVVPTVSEPPQPALRVDLELPLGRADRALIDELDVLAPYGQANPTPLFVARDVRIRYAEVVAERHWRFQALQGETAMRCIAFNMVERHPALREVERCDLIYEVELDHYRGETRVNVKVREILPLGRAAQSASEAVPLPRLPDTPTVARQDAAFSPCAGIPLNGSAWEVVDAREHENRGRYMADVVEQGHPTYVLCRRDQIAFVEKIVSGGEPGVPENMRAVAYGTALADVNAAQWLMFTPPNSLDALSMLASVPSGRCHVVFGAEQLAAEGALIDAVDMGRDRMGRIYRVLKAGADARGIFEERNYGQMLESSRQYDLRMESLKVAVRILCEIGVVEASTRRKGCYRLTGVRAELERSAIWRRYNGLSERFAPVRELFSKDADALREGLLKCLTNVTDAHAG